MKIKAASILVLICGFLIFVGWMTGGAGTARERELAAVLKPLLKPATYVLWSEEELKPAGMYEPKNRQAVKDFVTKYPGTEEAYQAEVWLAMAGKYSETAPYFLAEKQRQTAVAERLRIISRTTSRPGTRKMAELQRAFGFYQDQPGEHAGYYEQADEIISHIEDYTSEKDAAFQRYLQVLEMKPSDIEPTLRLLAAHEKGYDDDLAGGLKMARELERKFPHWETQSVGGLIESYELAGRGLAAPDSLHGVSRD